MSATKVLVCSDLSSYSDAALKAAGDYAKVMGGEIHVLNVAQTGGFLDAWGLETWVSENQRIEYLVKLNELLKEQAKRCGLQVKTKVTHDSSVTRSVLNHIEEIRPDILFVGHKGLTGMDKVLFGSVARKLVTLAPIPVMVIKKDIEMKNMGALVDGSDTSSEIISAAMKLSEGYKAGLSVISLVPSFPGIYSSISGEYSSSLIHALKEKLAEAATEMTTNVKAILNGYPAETIIKVSHEKDVGYHLKEILEDHDVNLAIVKKYSSSRLDQFLLGSISLRILELYQGNILVLH